MKTTYVAHIFGEEVERKLRSRRGWLSAGVASSIPWPSLDVCVRYDNDEYFLRGAKLNGEPSPPCITIACNDGEADIAISKIYRFTSILSWYLGGYVDVSGYAWASHPILYSVSRTVYSSLGIAGKKSFNCNYLPVIEEENVRLALAFWREARRLTDIHDSYAFLSYYKVIESQFSESRQKVDWISNNIERLTGRAAKRVSELRESGIDVSRHLFDSGRCAVAHATLDREIVDPDIPADRRRLGADLVVIEELARIYILDELKVPDSMSLHQSRNRLEPWESIISDENLELLKSGATPEMLNELQDLKVSVGLWPDGVIEGLENMTMHVDAVSEGVVKIVLINKRKTIFVVFLLDFKNGRVHTNLEDGGLLQGENEPNESDVKAYSTFFYKVLGNGVAELMIENKDPVDCDIVIPVNIIAPDPDKAISEAIERFRDDKKG